MKLVNKINSKELKKKIQESNEPRTTVSFYKYHHLDDVKSFRDDLFIKLDTLGVLGRIYVADEGINAQISVPTIHFDDFKKTIYSYDFMNGIRLNIAVDDNGKSFFKLAIKIRQKIVADGINDPTFDVTKIGKHLNAKDFNDILEKDDITVVDMRNHYESEVGHFEHAVLPDVDTFREQLPFVVELLKDKKDKPLAMYCTGGIRCEKASAYMLHHGFTEVYQLEGGIIKYAQQIKKLNLETKFKGKNFVFDERLSEKISDDVISECHQCGKPFDVHTNCANVACNLLFIQCDDCKTKYQNCCGDDCKEIASLPEEKQKELRQGKSVGRLVYHKGRKLKKTTAN